MATFWDASLLQYLAPVFIFILVFAIIYGLLQKSKILGGMQKLDFIVSLVVSLLTLISDNAANFVGSLSVWFVLIAVAVVMMTLMMSAGIKGEITEMPIGKGILLWVAIIVLMVVISTTFGPVFNPYSAGANPDWWALQTIFHPKVFGVVFLFLIAMILINKLKE
ncbi:hypothetical protein HN865_02320 [Candidatus Woesearchaeota archaeon]|jgi:hypothetical protein|nr:hypothetical protein [Candidatus Woesearchaeota archaeon]MBT7237669.1 hypothetical protein [Candidatus Woesearchaeota archaeon]